VKTFRLHLKCGLSATQYDRLVARLRSFKKAMSPVKGGGRNLIVAIDVTTGRREAAEHFAERRIWAKKRELHGARPVRVRVLRIEDVTGSVTPVEAIAS
jgi:hypothetical protein